MSHIGFDATGVTPQVGFVAAPKGKYQVIISESRIEPTKAGDGEIIVWTFVAQGGNQHGKQIVLNTNWKNNNPKAVEIGKGQLSAICHAVGVLNPQDTAQLHNRPFMLEIDVTPDGKFNQLVDIQPIASSQAPCPAAPVVNPYGAPATGMPVHQPPPYVAPVALPLPAPVIQRPTDPAHIHAAGTPGEQWWINGAWTPAVAAPPPAPMPPPVHQPQPYVAPSPAPVQPGYAGPPAVLESAETPTWIANQVAAQAAGTPLPPPPPNA